MIFSARATSKVNLIRNITPTDHTFAICLSNKDDGFRFEEGFFDTVYFYFLDDEYQCNSQQVLTKKQAIDIIDAIATIDRLPTHLDILICCDTGQTASCSVLKYIKEKYPKTTIQTVIEPNLLNNHVYATLIINECNGIKETSLQAAAKNFKEFKKTSKENLVKATQRNTKENITSLVNWVRNEF